MHGSDRREQLLATASQLLAKEGPRGLRPDRVAAAAGVSRPVVYDHFTSQDSLAAALIERYAAKLFARVERAFAAHAGDFEAGVRAALSAYLDCVAEEGAGLRILLGSIGHGADESRRRVLATAVAGWTSRIGGHTGLSARDARAAAVAVTASVWALAGLWLEGGISRRRLEDLHVTMVLGALAALARDA